jgi:hypothetical protein
VKQIHYFCECAYGILFRPYSCFSFNLVLVITALFLIIPLVINGYFKEIRQSLNGKLCIALLITQLYMILIFPFEESNLDVHHPFFTIIYFIGAFSSVFVVNLMCFDIFLTFKHFGEPHYQSTYFKKFVCFLLIFFVAVSLLTYVYTSYTRASIRLHQVLTLSMIFTFLLTCLMDIFALIASFHHLVALTRSSSLSENTRLDVERER